VSKTDIWANFSSKKEMVVRSGRVGDVVEVSITDPGGSDPDSSLCPVAEGALFETPLRPPSGDRGIREWPEPRSRPSLNREASRLGDVRVRRPSFRALVPETASATIVAKIE
jgi:hypothetical protein